MRNAEQRLLRIVEQVENVRSLVIGLFNELVGDANEFALNVLLNDNSSVVLDVCRRRYAGAKVDELGFSTHAVQVATLAKQLRHG